MTGDPFRGRGVALAERVRLQVEPATALDKMRKRRRREMTLATAVGAAAIIALIVAVATFHRSPNNLVADRIDAPVTTSPVDTRSSTNLPVTVYVALLDQFDAVGASRCVGSGIHNDIRSGTRVSVLDTGFDDAPLLLAEPVLAADGRLIDASRVTELGLPSTAEACLFELATISIDSPSSLLIEIGGQEWPPPSGFEAGAAQAGQQFVFYSRGSQP